jgi:hypothetical protein
MTIPGIRFNDGQSGLQMLKREMPRWLGKVIRHKGDQDVFFFSSNVSMYMAR